MLSAGLLGGPGIGYKQDYFASSKIKVEAPEGYERYKAENENGFLFFEPIKGLDGSKVGVLKDGGDQLEADIDRWESTGRDLQQSENLSGLNEWWNEEGQSHVAQDREPVLEAGFYGAGRALVVTAIIPVVMAIGYLVLILYFKKRGGYKQLHLEEE